MIPYGRHSLSRGDREAVAKTLASGYLPQGPEVPRFEKCLAKYCGASYAVAVGSGTAALHLSYMAAGIGMGDEVITTPNTFVATTNMLLALGAKPVFVDIRADTANLDERLIESAITPRTKAVVPVHFAGHPCEMQTIRRIARKHRLLVIEDACHALGARYRGKRIGALSDLSVFSFHPVKSITTGEGGAILTNRKDMYEKIKLMRSHGIEKDSCGFNVMKTFGYNYRMTDIQASLGVSQLSQLPSFLKRRRRVVSWYRKLLPDNKYFLPPREHRGIESSWHLFVLRTARLQDRLPLYRYLRAAGFGVNFHYPPVYSHPYYRSRGYARTELLEMERYARTAITLPLHPLLSKKEIEYLCEHINAFFQ